MGKRCFSGANCRFKVCIVPLGELVQRTDLPGNDANDQPAITYFDQDDTLARTQGDATDDLHSALTKTFATGQFAGQPGGAEKQSEDKEQGQGRLQIGAGRNARAGSIATPRGDRQQQRKEKA